MAEFAAILSATAWPIAACLIVMWLRPAGPTIRATIGEAFKRGGWKFGALGVTVEASAQQQKGEELSRKAIEAPPLALPPTPPESALGTMLAGIEADLEPMPEKDRVKALTYALANVRLNAGHEWRYNRIFGSQIALLKRLNVARSLVLADARAVYAETAAQHAEAYARYPFEDWLAWPVSNALIARDGDTLRLSPFGLDFLEYLTKAGLSEARPL